MGVDAGRTTAGNSRRLLAFGFAGAALLAVAGFVAMSLRHPPSVGIVETRGGKREARGPVVATEFHETFDAALDPARWTPTAAGDFKERVADVAGGRLRLRADTLETRDDTVKFLGVRSVASFPLGSETSISADLNWNEQANGSYLSAGLVLAPAAVDGNPLTTPDFLRVEYIGVPPGKNGRLVVVTRVAGREQSVFTEGWPERQRDGRKLGLQHVEIVLRKGAFEVRENGQVVYETRKPGTLPFAAAHLYLQMSSHSNYPRREVFFDNIRIQAAP